MAGKLKAFFKSFTAFDIVYLSLSIPLLIVVSILCGSDVLTTIYSIIAVLGVFLLTKGNFAAPILLLVAYCIYAYLSYRGALFGETIIYCALLIPIQIATIITWFVKKKKDNNQFIIGKVRLGHFLIALTMAAVGGVGAYFLLRAFNTSQLILSTITLVVSVLCNYFSLLKSEYAFIGFILNNVLFALLWLLPLLQGQEFGLSVLPMVVSGVLFCLLNIKGLITWTKMKKQQN